MNFLAHLVLAPQTPLGLIGSIAPDMIRGPLPTDLHPEVLAAAREHQRIDRATDAHPAFARTRQRLIGLADARLTGVLADVLYDHVLARDWSRWRPDDRMAFIKHAEQMLLQYADTLPDETRWRIGLMLRQHWLCSYDSVHGIHHRLAQMTRRITARLSRPMRLTPPVSEIERVYPGLAEDFAELWPDLLQLVADHRPVTHNDQPRLAS